MSKASDNIQYEHAIVSQAAIGIAALDVDGRWLTVNPYLCQLLGYTTAELLRTTIKEITHPDDTLKVIQITQSTASRSIGLRVFDKNGAMLWLKLTISLATTATSPPYWVLIIENTQSRNVNKSPDDLAGGQAKPTFANMHRYSAEITGLQKSIFDALPASIAVIDEVGNIISSNQQWYLFGVEHGLDQAQWGIGSNYFSACKTATEKEAQDALLVASGIRQVLKRNLKHFSYEYCCEILGSQLWYQMVAVPYPTSDNGGAIIMHFDVTESHITQLKLDAKEREFRALAEHSPDIIARFDANFRYLYANPAIEKVTGLAVDSFLHKTNLETGLPPSFASSYEQALKQVIVTGQEYVAELQFKNGPEPHFLHTRLVPEFDRASGQVSHVLAVSRDITDLKVAENKLRESRALMRSLAARSEEAREQERKRIAGEVHDELGQLLTALRMEVSLFSMEFGSLHPKLGAKTEDIKKLIDRTISVIRHIATTLRPAVLDAGINSALEWLAAEFSSRYNISCHLDIEENIQINEKQATVIFRICQESLTNVARHASASKVKILLASHSGQYELTIHDNGHGFKAHTPRKLDKYGLIGIQERAIMLGGVATIDSQPGKGTIVFLNIPINMHDVPND